MVTKDFTFINASTITKLGKISSSWKVENNKFVISIEVPIGAKCDVYLPSREIKEVKNGKYTFEEKINL